MKRRIVALLFVALGCCACQPLLGSYNGAGNVQGAQSFATETGTTANIYSDYLDSSNECSGNPYPLGQIQGQLASNEVLELSVPLPGFQLGQNGQALLAQIAANPWPWIACMNNLALNLVSDGFSNAILRPMWEPDSGIYSNDDLTSAANYAGAFRDMVNAMQVSGQHFGFAWYWGADFDSQTNSTAYPGDQYVTYVTFDQYDQSWNGSCGVPYNGSSWTPTQSNCIWNNDISHNLAGLASFASAHSKPISIGEWGVIDRSDGHGGGDDPTFVNNFVAWMESNNVAWSSYFNFNSGGNSILSDYPNSLAAFKNDLG